MACHTINVACMALELFDPESVEVIDTSGIVDHETYPVWSIIRTQFGPRDRRGPLIMTWYDGGENFPDGKKVYKELLYGEKVSKSGLLLVGEKGSFFSHNDNGTEHVLLPREKFKDFEKPKRTLPRSPGHFTEFVECDQVGRSDQGNVELRLRRSFDRDSAPGRGRTQDRLEDRLGSPGPEGQELLRRRPVHPPRLSQGVLDPLRNLTAILSMIPRRGAALVPRLAPRTVPGHSVFQFPNAFIAGPHAPRLRWKELLASSTEANTSQ